MLEPPTAISDAEVLAAVREHWSPAVRAVTYLAVGWGGHHWRADTADGPALFVTLDIPLPRHTAESLEGAYAAAAAAAMDLDFVWPSLRTAAGRFTVPLPWGTLSVCGWLDGERPAACTPDLPAMLARLHAVRPPGETPVWGTLVAPDLVPRLQDLAGLPWAEPLGPLARDLVVTHLDEVRGWAAEHARLLAEVDRSSFVVTHGEPGVHNQYRADGRVWLIDWESLLLAPRERDLVTLLGQGLTVDHDPRMVRLFDLEWRLEELWSFATWLQAPHRGDADDRTALSGLEHELTRPHVSS